MQWWTPLVEMAARLALTALGAYLASIGHPVAGLGVVGVAAQGDLPGRMTSTGASSGRAEVAEDVVADTVKKTAQKP